MGYPVRTMANPDFRLDPGLIYLNHAAVSPWPQRTAEAVTTFAEENARLGSRNYPRWMQTEQAVRQQLQRLINAASADEIALLKNTSEALSVVAWGLSWKAGDNVVITDQEFPSNRIVWESLAPVGVETRAADITRTDNPEAAIIDRIDANTRLVSVSAVQYGTGLKLDLEMIGAACRDRNVLFCVDAIQSLGAMTFDVRACGADFVMADAHKWMLGPEGIALFYCRAEVMEQLSLKQYGWHMVEDFLDFDRHDWEIAGSARRFECGSPNMTGIHALHASLSLLEETGMQNIEQRVLENSRYLIDFIQDHGDELELITPPADDRHAGIVTFRPRHEAAQSLFDRLGNENVLCALRGGG
ncbi:MAG: aminotransferase class V-fold PLP-dependent enzyme, partial [Gammaproteobacteria bacterium]